MKTSKEIFKELGNSMKNAIVGSLLTGLFLTLAILTDVKWFSIITVIIGCFYGLGAIFSIVNIFKLLRLHSKAQKREHEEHMNEWNETIRNWQERFNRDYDDFMKRKKENYQAYSRAYSRAYNSNYRVNYISVDVMKSFKLFGLPLESDVSTIKKKYRSLVMIHHPDRYSNDSERKQEIAKRNLQKLNNAYSIIKKYKNFN